jgi:hypothetical protein
LAHNKFDPNMGKLEVTKTIEARKLNKRTRQPVAEPPVTIPYGAILSDVVENDGMIAFMHLGDLYQCRMEILRPASSPLEGGRPAGSGTTGPAAAAPAQEPVTFTWQKLAAGREAAMRAKLPGGWLISIGEGTARSVVFYPDPKHEWDGTTL